jgi:hypothetical protein
MHLLKCPAAQKLAFHVESRVNKIQNLPLGSSDVLPAGGELNSTLKRKASPSSQLAVNLPICGCLRGMLEEAET